MTVLEGERQQAMYAREFLLTILTPPVVSEIIPGPGRRDEGKGRRKGDASGPGASAATRTLEASGRSSPPSCTKAQRSRPATPVKSASGLPRPRHVGGQGEGVGLMKPE